MQPKAINWIKVGAAMLLLILLTPSSEGVTIINKDDDDRHKAMYLLNLVRYIDWNQQEVTIGIVGNSPVTGELQELAQKSKKVQIKTFAEISAIEDCNILFLPGIETRSFSVVQDQLGTGEILIVVDNKSLIHRGAEMGFFIEDEKLKFAVNKGAIEQTGIKVSNSLLEKARSLY